MGSGGSLTSWSGWTGPSSASTDGPGQDFGGRLPSEVFREHIVTCFIDDPAGVAQREEVGLETICWEADYPHSDSTWPISPERLMRSLGGVPDEEIEAITHENAMRHFRYDPFADPPEERVHGRSAPGPGDGRRHGARPVARARNGSRETDATPTGAGR